MNSGLQNHMLSHHLEAELSHKSQPVCSARYLHCVQVITFSPYKKTPKIMGGVKKNIA